MAVNRRRAASAARRVEWVTDELSVLLRWLWWLDIVDWVRLCTYELWWSKESVADGAEATLLSARGVDSDEASGAKSPKGSCARVLAEAEVGGERSSRCRYRSTGCRR